MPSHSVLPSAGAGLVMCASRILPGIGVFSANIVIDIDCPFQHPHLTIFSLSYVLQLMVNLPALPTTLAPGNTGRPR